MLVIHANILSNTGISQTAVAAATIQQAICYTLMMISAKSAARWPMHKDPAKPKDLFMQENGFAYAGRHLLLDCWNSSHLDDLELIEKALREAVKETGATLLHIHLHHFTPNGGVSGVAVLAESHISIHTWPERDYAALDIFMCGETQPEKAIPVFKNAFRTETVNVSEHLRGRLLDDLTPLPSEKTDLV